MKFYEALKKMIEEGVQVKRKNWDRGEFWKYDGEDEDDPRLVYNERDFYCCYGEVSSISNDDLFADDWEIDNEKYYDMYEAFEMMKNGAKMLCAKEKHNNCKYVTYDKEINRFVDDNGYVMYADHDESISDAWYLVREDE